MPNWDEYELVAEPKSEGTDWDAYELVPEEPVKRNVLGESREDLRKKMEQARSEGVILGEGQRAIEDLERTAQVAKNPLGALTRAIAIPINALAGQRVASEVRAPDLSGVLEDPVRMLEQAIPQLPPGIIRGPESPVTGVQKAAEETAQQFLDPEMATVIPLFGPAASKAFPLLTTAGRGAISGQMIQGIPESARQASEVLEDPNATVSDKAKAIASGLIHTGIAGQMTAHAVPQPLQPIPSYPRAVVDAEMPRGARPERDITTVEVTTPEQAAELTKSMSRETAFEPAPAPRPVVPEGPSDPRVVQAQQAGAKTIEDVLRMFPEMQRNRESARIILRQVQELERTNAQQNAQATTVHGDVRQESTEGKQTVPTEESGGGVSPSGSKEVKPAVPLSGEQIAKDLGIQWGGQTGKLWHFHVIDPKDGNRISFSMKSGATPEQIKARVEQELANYAESPPLGTKIHEPPTVGEIDPVIGAKYDGPDGQGRLRYTTFKPDGSVGTSFWVDEGSTPEQVRAKYQEVLDRFKEDDPGRPRPLPEEAPEPLDVPPEYNPGYTASGELHSITVNTPSGERRVSVSAGQNPDGTGDLKFIKLHNDKTGSYENIPVPRPNKPFANMQEAANAGWKLVMEKFKPAEQRKAIPESTSPQYSQADAVKLRALQRRLDKTTDPTKRAEIQKKIDEVKPVEPTPTEGGGIGGAIQRAIDKNKEAGAVNLPSVNEVLTAGRELFQKAKDFASWSVEMVKRFGDWIKDHVRDMWSHFTGELKSPNPEWRVTVQNEQRYGNTVIPGYVQIDDISGGKNKWSKNPKSLREEGFNIPAGIEGLPQGRYTMADVQARLKQSGEKGIGKSVRNVSAAESKAGILGVDLTKLARARQALVARMRARPTRQIMDQGIDAADNKANILGRQMANRVRTGITPEQDRAASAVIAADFNQANLPTLLAQAVAGGNEQAANAVRYAMNNWTTTVPIAQRGKNIFDAQIANENFNGINTQYAEAYLPGIYDMDMMMGSSRPYVIGGKGSGVGSAFKKGKSFANPFEAIEAGYKPQSLALSELVEHRVKSGQKMVNRVEWSNALRGTVDPTDSKPIVTSLVQHSRGPGQPGWEAPPMGYERRTVIPGVDVAIHEGYSKLFDALTGQSKIGEFEPGGVPVGTLALEGAGALKHGMLLFDTFHASRIGQKQMFLTKQLPSYKKGLSLLEYTDSDLARAVAAGEITPEMQAYAIANRPRANLLIDSGLNVGRIQEALYTSLARKIPIIGTFNKWVFEKMTRGAMLESGLIEFDRVKKNNPTWTDEQVARKVSRDLNAYFGNLGRQGVFKSSTFQDAARLVALAPQWVESMARSELGGAKQLTIDPLRQRKLVTGSLGAGLAQGLLAYFVGTQLLNLATRGQLTFQNPEKDHKWDAWIPDVTGKSKGYFLSPMGVVSEMTHDFMKYVKDSDNPFEAAGRILANKASPYWRAGKVLISGRDWKDQKVVGAWNRILKSGEALAPIPIIASPAVKESAPGKPQQQVMASFGFKTEPAGTAQSTVYQMAGNWMRDSKDPLVRDAYKRKEQETLPESQYKPLRDSLIKGELDKAKAELRAIYEKEPSKEKRLERKKLILRTFHPFSKVKDKASGTTVIRSKPFATGKREYEDQFIASLDDDGKKFYREAVQERVNLYKALTEALDGKAKYPPDTPPEYRR